MSTDAVWSTDGSKAARSEEHTSELQSHSDLHSFPTRRSSDLPFPSLARGSLGQRTSCGCGDKIASSQHCQGNGNASTSGLARYALSSPIPSPTRRCPPTPSGPRMGQKQLDRKSTRLNSSHTVIYTLSLHDALPICRSRVWPEVALASAHPADAVTKSRRVSIVKEMVTHPLPVWLATPSPLQFPHQPADVHRRRLVHGWVKSS